MTGMQINAGTAPCFQKNDSKSIDIARIVPALGVDQFFNMDPFDFPSSVATIQKSLQLPGVKVILSRRECAIQSMRRNEIQGKAVVDLEKCALCKLCINITGCPALSIDEKEFVINGVLCNGCGLCVATCNLDALRIEVTQ